MTYAFPRETPVSNDPLDVTRMAPHLYQGSFPEPFQNRVKDAGFDVLVLCAAEHQPPAAGYAGVKVIYAPMDDAQIVESDPDWRTANEAADEVVYALRSRKRVLVTCAAGRNRSGLVVALAMLRVSRASAVRVVEHIQKRRDFALSNRSFVEILKRYRPAMLWEVR